MHYLTDLVASGSLEDERLGNEKDTDIVDISEEIKDTAPEKKDEKKVKHKKKEKEVPKEQEVSVNEFRSHRKEGARKVIIILLIVAAVIGFITWKVIEAKNKLEEMMAGSKAQTAQIERRDISSTINTTGTIQSKDVRTLTSPLTGVKIDKVDVKVGDMVNEGDVVVTFSREDINKKIGQLEEDITEAKQVKALDSGDRNNTYVNGYDLQTYSVATSYEKFKKAETDLQKAKDDLARACSEKGDYKSKYEEAKEKIGGKKEELYNKEIEYKRWKVDQGVDGGDPPDMTKEENIKKDQTYQDEISALNTKVTTYDSTIKAYDSGITSYENSERSAQTALDTAQKNYDNAWVDYNKAGYDASFSDAKSDYTKNKGDLQANDNIKSLERQKEQNEDTLENYIVTAPITGLVTAVNAQEGNGYQATTGALMTIQAVDVYEVTTQVDEYDINNVKIGQKVAIMTDATGSDEFEGKVTFVAPTATTASGNSTSNTFEVKIDILKKDDRLRLGMSAKINILVDTHDNVLAVPYDAIEEKDGGTTVIYVVDNSAPASGKKGDKDATPTPTGIQVIGVDGETKSDGTSGETSAFAEEKRNAKEIQVQIGLESDYYTEIISPEIKEGMTVLVDSKAGELQNDMDMFRGM